MNASVMVKAKIVFELQKVGKSLSADGSESGPKLRKLQSELNSMDRFDPILDFVRFFISSFIDDVFYNLSGDFPYRRETHEIVGEIFRGIGNALISLSESISRDGLDRSIAYESMVNLYLDGLDRINAYFGQMGYNNK